MITQFYNPQWCFGITEDFSGADSEFFSIGTNETSGSSFINPTNITNQHPGIVTLTTGTDSTGIGEVLGVTSNNGWDGSFLTGGGELSCEFCFNIPTLSDGTDTYRFRIGFSDQVASGATGFYEASLGYHSPTSANWILQTARNNSHTDNISSTPVTTGWNKGKVVINADASLITYYINGISIGTVSTNIPDQGSTSNIGFVASIIKSAGTTARTVDIDYIKLKQKITNRR